VPIRLAYVRQGVIGPVPFRFTEDVFLRRFTRWHGTRFRTGVSDDLNGREDSCPRSEGGQSCHSSAFSSPSIKSSHVSTVPVAVLKGQTLFELFLAIRAVERLQASGVKVEVELILPTALRKIALSRKLWTRVLGALAAIGCASPLSRKLGEIYFALNK